MERRALIPFVPQTGGYGVEAGAVFAAYTGPVNNGHRNNVNALIEGLKSDGVWRKLDVLCVVGPHEGDSLINLVSPGTFNGSVHNGATFTADRGWKSADPNPDSCINTNFKPHSDGVNMTLASSSMFCYRQTIEHYSGGFVYHMGAQDVSQNANFACLLGIEHDYTYNAIVGSLGNAVLYANAKGSRVERGMVMINHLSGNHNTRYNSSDSIGGVRTVYQLPDIPVMVGCVNQNFDTPAVLSPVLHVSGDIYSAWGMGAGMTSTERDKLNQRINEYMIARGARGETHNYMRFRMIENNSPTAGDDALAMTRLEFRPTSTGNYEPVTPMTSNNQDGNTAFGDPLNDGDYWHVFDGDSVFGVAHIYSSGSDLERVIGIQWGTPMQFDTAKISCKLWGAPVHWTIEGSDDGVTYSTLVRQINDSWSSNDGEEHFAGSYAGV